MYNILCCELSDSKTKQKFFTYIMIGKKIIASQFTMRYIIIRNTILCRHHQYNIYFTILS